jgi:hypothetical protein
MQYSDLLKGDEEECIWRSKEVNIIKKLLRDKRSNKVEIKTIIKQSILFICFGSFGF